MGHVINDSNKVCEYMNHVFSKAVMSMAAFALAILIIVSIKVGQI